MGSTTALKDRLKELNEALVVKADDIENHAMAWKDETGKGEYVIGAAEYEKFLKAVNEADEIRQAIAVTQKGLGIFSFIEQPVGDGPVAGAEQTGHRLAQMGAKSLADEWLASGAFAEMKESGFRRFGQVAGFERGLSSFQQKDVYSAMAGTITLPALGTQENLGLTQRMLRPGRVRDLFPAERTTANLLWGIRETGFTNRAATVPERRAADGTSPPTGGPTDVFGLKPRSDLTIVPISYPISTIAHIMYAHKNTMDDEPRLRGLMDRDMVDGVKMQEDWQILYGDGIGENLTGLFNTSGVQTYTGLSSDSRSAQVRRAMTRSILAYFMPSGVVMHPLDWEDLELEKDKNGAYIIAVSVAVGGEKRVWRLSVVDTPAIQEGKFILGAWGTGAKLYDREQVNIQVSTENRDMFERNAVTIRCEERIGLVVDRPESFVIGTFTTPA
ncbi:phage major capsid protein [Streptosporangium sp. NPDC051023]|uniref:phage major capsid protein n=1 Tax=Streptosporangium sp. NPDC051023 TaxID=3155410 RepID=UPI00344BBE5B